MELAAGTRLAQYEIVALLGRGGMGEVWRATDTRLGRDVALKVLPDEFTRDAQRMARFEREARLLAALDHPNIASIYEIGAAQGIHYLVMQLADGEDLSARLARGALPAAEALAVARQLAEALEAAHEKGIVHRDLKPANVKIGDEGQVRVLDFGLAKALGGDEASAPDLSASPTMAHPATHAGVILGTAAYMSPEQARGRKVDRRADIWSFGVVLYEMLSGTRLFAGETTSDTLAAVLTREPDWNALPPGLPPAIRRLLARCLDRNPRTRLRDVGEARVLLEHPEEAAAAPAGPGGRPARPRSRAGPVLAGLALLAGAAWLGRWTSPAPASGPGEVRFDITPPGGVKIVPVDRADAAKVIWAITEDGRTIAFQGTAGEGQSQLYLRPLDSAEARVIAGTEGATSPFFSPDGREIAFESGRKLRRVPVEGGAPRVICDLDAPTWGGTWLRDGTIIFSAWNSGLLRVPADGGTPAPLTRLEGEHRTHASPVALPDGDHYLYRSLSSVEGREGDRRVMIGSLRTGEQVRLLDNGYRAGFVSPDWLLYMSGSQLIAQRLRFGPPRLEGEVVTVGDEVSVIPSPGSAGFAASSSGTIVYRHREGLPTTQLAWFDRKGRRLGDVGGPSRDVSVRLSPDQTRAAVGQVSEESHSPSLEVPANLWVVDLARGLRTRVSFDPNTGDENPVWSPDGHTLTYASHRKSGAPVLAQRPASGGGAETTLSVTTDLRPHPFDWSPDGRWLLFQGSGDQANSPGLDLLAYSPRDQRVTPFATSPFFESQGQFSPDGRFVAYTSNESGRMEVYVRPFPEGDGRWQVSNGGGGSPRWRRDGRELVYLSLGGAVMSVPVRLSPSFEASAAVPLFEAGLPPTPFNFYGGDAPYDVTGDGARFLLVTPRKVPDDPPLSVIVGWRPPADRVR